MLKINSERVVYQENMLFSNMTHPIIKVFPQRGNTLLYFFRLLLLLLLLFFRHFFKRLRTRHFFMYHYETLAYETCILEVFTIYPV